MYRLSLMLLLLSQCLHLSASEELSLLGSLRSHDSLTVVSEIDGVITSLGYDRGEQVSESKSLVQIDSEDYLLMLAKAKASLALSKADMKAKRARVERYRKLKAKNSLSQEQLDNAEAEFQISAFTVDLQELAFEDAQLDLQRTIIMPEADYWVTEKLIEKGDWVQKGQTLYRLENFNKLEAVVYVTENHINRIHPGQSVTIYAEALPSKTFTGEILRIGIKPEPSKNSYPIDIIVNNRDGLLRSGFTVDARINVNIEQE